MEELVKRMSFASGMTEEEILSKIEDKKLELSGLISDEGAAYIVAKEIGLDVFLLTGKERSSPAEAGRNFVRNEKYLVPFAQFP